MMRTLALKIGWLGLAALLASACSTPPRWRADDMPTETDVELLLRAESSVAVVRRMRPEEIPDVPARERFRPCCAFGADLRAGVGPVPVPMFVIGNLLGVDELGNHRYDSGVVKLGPSGDNSSFFQREPNGLVYTCRGGFIDTAHVRDVADWTLFLASQIARNLETGMVLELPDEGGQRRIVLEPVDEIHIERVGRRPIAIELGQWAAFQISIWHEIATWYGWSTLPAFPETASAFSPEDLYSNILGAKIYAALASQRSARSEFTYNRSFDEWLHSALLYLGAVPPDVASAAMQSVDQRWWDSRQLLPQRELVIRRNFEIGARIEPWLVPPEIAPASLVAACGRPDPEPVTIENPPRVGHLACGDLVRLEITPETDLAAALPAEFRGAVLSSQDFPQIVAATRELSLRDFGPGSDAP